MTPFERAQIRLRAWEALAGWGTKKEGEKLSEPWNWDKRLEYADQLAEWSASDLDNQQLGNKP